MWMVFWFVPACVYLEGDVIRDSIYNIHNLDIHRYIQYEHSQIDSI